MSIPELLAYYSDLLPISIFLLLLFSQRGKISLPLWVILFYCIYSFVSNTLLYNQKETTYNLSWLIYGTFTIIEYSTFALAICYLLIRNRIKLVLIYISICFILFCIISLLFKPNYRFDSLHISIEAIILLGFCIVYLFEQISMPEVVFLYASYHFWIIIGILIYLAVTFFLYAFASNLPYKILNEYWIINHFGNILKNIMFTIAIIIYVKPPKMHNHGEYRPFLN